MRDICPIFDHAADQIKQAAPSAAHLWVNKGAEQARFAKRARGPSSGERRAQPEAHARGDAVGGLQCPRGVLDDGLLGGPPGGDQLSDAIEPGQGVQVGA